MAAEAARAKQGKQAKEAKQAGVASLQPATPHPAQLVTPPPRIGQAVPRRRQASSA